MITNCFLSSFYFNCSALKGVSKGVLGAVCITLLSGCAGLAGGYYHSSGDRKPASYTLSQDNATPITQSDINQFLSQSPSGGVFYADDSPWGSNVEIIADAPYLAASGRECRKLRVVLGSGTASTALACATPNGWASQRVLLPENQ